jgi:hypothetical protein
VLVFYSGWGYNEYSMKNALNKVVSDYPRNVCGLFDLPKSAELEMKYKGETTTDCLFESSKKHPDIIKTWFSNPDDYIGRVQLNLCEEWEENEDHSITNPIINKFVKFTRDDVVAIPDDMPNTIAVTEQDKIATIAIPSYLDKNHPMYSDELNIAIKAWEAVLECNPIKPKSGSRKKLIEEWLRLKHPELTKEAKTRITTLLNPDKNGGAPTTNQIN